jgi:hypothetical protein
MVAAPSCMVEEKNPEGGTLADCSCLRNQVGALIYMLLRQVSVSGSNQEQNGGTSRLFSMGELSDKTYAKITRKRNFFSLPPEISISAVELNLKQSCTQITGFVYAEARQADLYW